MHTFFSQYGQDGTINTSIDSLNNSTLSSYLINNNTDGIIKFHPFNLEDIGGWDNFINAISSDPNSTFKFVRMSKSRLFEGTYFKYKQYYKDIPVKGGGFTILIEPQDVDALIDVDEPPCNFCPPPNPCALVSMISPNIFEGISIDTEPELTENSISSILGGENIRIDKIELNIKQIDKVNYDLIYRVDYYDSSEGELMAQINANTGKLLSKSHHHAHINAPTQDYGEQLMMDKLNGSTRSLENDRLVVYDLSTVTATTTNQVRDQLINTDNIPTCPSSQSNWLPSDVSSNEIYQLFWMADGAIDVFKDDLGVDFKDVHVGYFPTIEGAFSFGPLEAIPENETRFMFGANSDGSFVEYDIIGHELAHAITREYFSNEFKEGASLSEGICDMYGVYIESKLEPDGLDWQMGDDIPSSYDPSTPGQTRNLADPFFKCYDDVINNTDEHLRSEPLGYWFHLLINGSTNSGIFAMDIEEILDLIYESMFTMYYNSDNSADENPDYEDLMTTMLSLASWDYGLCSDEFTNLVLAWEEICISTPYNLETICDITLQGTSWTCEESNSIYLCLSPPNALDVDLESGRWRIFGKNSYLFQSVKGMQGNTQHGGNCININFIPTMPYYPQTISIQYYHPYLGKTLTKIIRIEDCDGDDPTCEDYYSDNYNITENEDNISLQKHESDRSNTFIDNVQLIVYDLFGNIIDIKENQINSNNFDKPQILIFTYWDKNGNLIESKKRFVQ